jgi:UDP-N-acetyl-D-galactosamine dehydrogenase
MSKVSVIGLGYVGLPLAVEFSKYYEVVGFDISKKRVSELLDGIDSTLEVESALLQSSNMIFTDDLNLIKDATIYIVTVPTPITNNKQPDLTPLIKASETVGKVLKKGDIVIYESTVYPGCTEEDCVPVLEKNSGLKFNKDFYCGYSPERINPGDKERTVTKITKIVSGSTPEIADKIQDIYGKVITAGTFKASSIKVAEAAKVIENTQRDINIAFVNELSLIFSKMGLDTLEVLEAAGTKWNFLPFKPGLVGGHCIGVDPYYLTHKAESLGYHPQVILSGRRINDGMGQYVANQIVKLMIKKNQQVQNAKVLVLGITFKENCPDIRNSRVIDIISELKEFGCEVDVFDPWASIDEVKHEYGITMIKTFEMITFNKYSAVVVAVGHNEFKEIKFERIRSLETIFYDLKGLYSKELSDGRL